MAFIEAVKTWMFKATDLLIGNSVFFIVILGWFFIITGWIFLARPEQARTKLLRQGAGAVKAVLTLFLIYLALTALSVGGKIGGWAGSAGFSVVVFLVWGYFYLLKRSSDLLSRKLALVPVAALRIYAVIQIIVGILMVTLQKRIW